MEKVKEKLKMMNPEMVLEKFLKWFDSKKRMAFLITLFAGIITHITMLTEMIMSQDGLWNSIQYYRPTLWEATLGRWGIALIERFNFFLAIPTVSTISSILCLAIAAVFLVDLFEFKSKISVIFTSLILVLTPTLTVTLLYIYTAFAYCANFLISTLVIWFLYKFKYKIVGFILSAVCLMLSLSIYQSYIGVSIGLCVMLAVLDLIRNQKKLKEILINIVKAIAVTIIGLILYCFATQLVLEHYGLEPTNYQNYGSSLNITNILQNLGNSISNTYKDFMMFFLGNEIINNTNYRREVPYKIFLIILGIASVLSIIFMKEKNTKIKIIRAILAALFISAIPVALNVVDIIITENQMYALTAVQMILIIPFAFAMFENIDKSIILNWTAILCCLYIMGTYYIANNTSYAAMKLTYNQAYSTAVRVMDRIENTPGYVMKTPILFGGIVGNYNFERTSSLYTYSVGSITTNPTFHGSYGGAIGTWVKFIQIYLGLDVIPCSAESYYNIVTSEEYKEMDMFPGENSVKMIDGIVVVKFHDDINLPY